jgi:hypothetical protein
MAKARSTTDRLQAFLQKTSVATLAQLKQVLGTTGTMTVFRRLKELGYLSSYSHRGKYYTLRQIPDFDAQGLWDWHAVWFSQYGNLVETACEFVDAADRGVSAGELQQLLHVECQRALLKLHQDGRVARARLGGVQVYLSQDPDLQRRQRWRRQEETAAAELVPPQVEVLSHELRAAIILFFSLLDERQRRLYAGLEAQKFGHGGDRKIAALLELDVHTVARGRRELFAGEVAGGRVRREGGGRQAVEKKHRTSSKPSSD